MKLKPPPSGVILTVNRSAIWPTHPTAAITVGSEVTVPSFGFADESRFEVLKLEKEKVTIRAM